MNRANSERFLFFCSGAWGFINEDSGDEISSSNEQKV